MCGHWTANNVKKIILRTGELNVSTTIIVQCENHQYLLGTHTNSIKKFAFHSYGRKRSLYFCENGLLIISLKCNALYGVQNSVGPINSWIWMHYEVIKVLHQTTCYNMLPKYQMLNKISYISMLSTSWIHLI